MIKFENRFNQYAYPVATRDAAAAIVSGSAVLDDGTWVTIDSDGKMAVSDGTKKSFMSLTSNRKGRDNVGNTPVSKVAYLMGVYEVTVANTGDTDTVFDSAKTYAAMTPLCVDGGKLRPWISGTDTTLAVQAYSAGAVVDGNLRVIVSC